MSRMDISVLEVSVVCPTAQEFAKREGYCTTGSSMNKTFKMSTKIDLASSASSLKKKCYEIQFYLLLCPCSIRQF